LATIRTFEDDEEGQTPGNTVNPTTFEQQQGQSQFGKKSGASNRFQNLQKFIKANDPSQLASNVQQGIGERSGQIEKTLDKSKDQFLKSTNPEEQRLQQAEQTTQSGS